MAAKEILLNWLANDNLQKVLQGLFSLAGKYRDELLRDKTTFQSGRQKNLETQRINSTISHEEEALQSAKIRDALLQIIKNIPDDWILDEIKNLPTPISVASKMKWKKYIAYFAAVVAVLAGIAELSGYSLRDIFGKNEKMENSTLPQPPVPNVSTSGDNSPAVITRDGDVNINYGAGDVKKDSTDKKPNPQK